MVGIVNIRIEQNVMSIRLSHITISVTTYCNLSCKGCYTRSIGNETLDINRFTENILKPFVSLGGRSIGFTGGEPLMYSEIYKLIEIAKQYSLYVSLVTNGTLLNEENAKQLHNLGLDSLQISLDTFVSEDNDFIRGKGNKANVIKALRCAESWGLSPILVAVPNKSLYENIDEYIIEAINHHVRSIYLRRRINKVDNLQLNLDLEFNRDFLVKIREISKRNTNIRINSGDPLYCVLQYEGTDVNVRKMFAGCSAGINSLAIKANGDVIPCTRVDVPIGNVYKEDLRDIWEESPVLHRLRKRELKGECNICKFKFLCGGCRASALINKGDIYESDPMCFLYK